MTVEDYDRIFRFCAQVREQLQAMFSGVQWQVSPIDINGQIAFADLIEGVPSEVTISAILGSSHQGAVCRRLCVTIGGAELAACKTLKHRQSILDQFCARLIVSLRSPSVLQPSTRSNFVGKLGDKEIAADYPICLRHEKTNRLWEFLSTRDALDAYFAFGQSPGADINDYDILQWDNGRWCIVPPDNLLRRTC